MKPNFPVTSELFCLKKRLLNAIFPVMYSAVPEKVQSGAKMYRWRKYNVSGVINALFNKYEIEGVAMPYTFEDFQRDYVLEHFHKLPPKELFAEIRKYLGGFTPEEKKEYLKDVLDQFDGLSRKDMVNALRKQLSGFTLEEKKVCLEDVLDQFDGLSRKDMVNALRKRLSGFTPEEKKMFADELLKSDK